ncbi:hypothetical protein TrRE_jg5279 [Triparma retinervis]|uniref:Uncharacterized protein n=1 Tax=Triparma retinervis TaxID=2557542 RepID=A0A9W7E0B1_9STRA|nr:hypothetical protein TrRE_jg5279 [Triparma retinervis]
MVRRGKFQTRVDINPQDYDLFGNKTFIKERIEDDNPMVDLPIEKVFAFSRIKRPIEAFHFLFFFLWTPFGLVLMVLRLIIMLSFLGTFYYMGKFPFWQPVRRLAPSIFVYIIMPMCGIFHTVRGKEYKDAVHVDKCIFVR